MADIASARSKLNTDEVAQDKPITEALHTKVGADINYLIDERDSHETDINANTAAIAVHESRLDLVDTDFSALAVSVSAIDSRVTVLEAFGVSRVAAVTYTSTFSSANADLDHPGGGSPAGGAPHFPAFQHFYVVIKDGNYHLGYLEINAAGREIVSVVDSGQGVSSTRWATVHLESVTNPGVGTQATWKLEVFQFNF